MAQLNFFGYYDERNRADWQSALRRADGSERPANAAVASAIAAGCTTGLRSWSPLAKPEGAAVEFASINPKAKGRRLVVRYATVSASPQVLAVVLSAAMNPSRAAVFTSSAFKAAATPAAKPASAKKPARKGRSEAEPDVANNDLRELPLHCLNRREAVI